MGTLDEDMAQEADIAELQENFNEVVEREIAIDHIEEELNQMKEKLNRVTEKEKLLIYRKRRVTEEMNRRRRLDSLRPRTTPKKYKF